MSVTTEKVKKEELDCQQCLRHVCRPGKRGVRTMVGITQKGALRFKIFRCDCCWSDLLVGPIE